MAVYHNVKGDQSAKKGDWLVGPDDAERGEIEVIKDADFQRDYEPIGWGPNDEEPEKADATLDENVIGNADGGYDTTKTDSKE